MIFTVFRIHVGLASADLKTPRLIPMLVTSWGSRGAAGLKALAPCRWGKRCPQGRVNSTCHISMICRKGNADHFFNHMTLDFGFGLPMWYSLHLAVVSVLEEMWKPIQLVLELRQFVGRGDPSPNLIRGARKSLVQKQQKQKHHVMWGTLVLPRCPTSPSDF